MPKGERQNFSEKTKKTVAMRAGWRCSNPNCRKLICCPGESDEIAFNLGDVAHITAASPGGPRYAKHMDKQERTSCDNAIFLCKECASMIDQDANHYTVEMLQRWKQEAEAWARLEHERGGVRSRYGYTAKELLPYNDSVALVQIKDIFSKNLEFFPENELPQMENMVQQLEQEDFPYALLKGMPASGKSVFLYEIAKRFDKKEYKVYYYTCKDGFIPYDVVQDLSFYQETNPMGKKLYIIDDIHLSQERVLAFFVRILNEKLEGAILFASRITANENRNYMDDSIYTRLKNVTYQLKFTPDSKDTKKRKSQQFTMPDSINKIRGIVQTFSESIAGGNGLKRLADDEVAQLADELVENFLLIWRGIFGKAVS